MAERAFGRNGLGAACVGPVASRGSGVAAEPGESLAAGPGTQTVWDTVTGGDRLPGYLSDDHPLSAVIRCPPSAVPAGPSAEP